MAGNARRPGVLVSLQSTAVASAIMNELRDQAAFEVFIALPEARSVVSVATTMRPKVAIMDDELTPAGCVGVLDHLTATGLVPDLSVIVVTGQGPTDPGLAISAGARAVVTNKDVVGRFVSLARLLMGTDLVIRPASGIPGFGASVEQVLERLTPRELEVFRLVACGYGCRRIAATLGMRESTARSHLHSVLHKLGLRDRAEAVAFAHQPRLLSRLGSGRRARAGLTS